MKKNVLCAVWFLSFVLSQAAFAASGKAVVPRYVYYSGATEWFVVSNITAQPTNVTFTLMRAVSTNGQPNILTSSNVTILCSNCSNLVTPSSGATATFTIQPYNTVELSVSGSGSGESGYGYIEWSQTSSTAVTSLLGFIFNQASGGGMPLNGGQPF